MGVGLVIVLAACPAGDDESTSNASADSSSDDTGTSTTVTTTMAETSASTTASMTEATSSTTTANPTSATSTTDTSTTGTGDPGTECGDFFCEQMEYCDWPTNDCGNPGADPPTCLPNPEGCPGVESDPVCGCDGVVYPDECTASISGVDVDEANGCTAPGEFFPCGFKFCDPATSYCQVSTSDIGGFPNSFSCLPLPAGCAEAPGCDCLADEPCTRFSCTDRGGGSTVVCPGG